MANMDRLQAIDYLREKANVSYEEAMQLLDQHDGDVMPVMVELEKQGRLYAQRHDRNTQADWQANVESDVHEATTKAKSFLKDFANTRVVIEKKGQDGEAETVANVSAPIAAGITVFAPYITLAAGALGLATGYNVKVEKKEDEN